MQSKFDGGGHDARNDERKAAICDFFKVPMIRVKESHLDAKVFEDTAVGFFIWQLVCVDAFLEQYEDDPYEDYDPFFFASIPGKDRSWPFAYAGKVRTSRNAGLADIILRLTPAASVWPF